MDLELRGSVGHGGVNRSGDVRALKKRLASLGFGFFATNGKVDSGLIMAIKLYQSIIHGHSVLGGHGVDGRVDPSGFTSGYLDSSNSPQWQLMPLKGPGFLNHELLDENDNHDYGTNWMAKTIIKAGQAYKKEYLRSNKSAALIAVNDVSIEHGGDTPDHKGHETGLSCDLRLPRIDGTSGGILNPNTNSHYDRDAMRAQLEALWRQDLMGVVLFNDSVLIDEGLCQHAVGHGDHVHFNLLPKPK